MQKKNIFKFFSKSTLKNLGVTKELKMFLHIFFKKLFIVS